MVVGTLIGMAAGYSRRMDRRRLMRFTDAFIVIPWLALAIVPRRAPRPEPVDHHHDHRFNSWPAPPVWCGHRCSR